MAPQKPESTKSKIFIMALTLLIVSIVFGIVFVLIMLAQDVWTISYLTPFAHVLKTIFAPFVPFIMPLSLGVFIKVCKKAPFPMRKSSLMQYGGMTFGQWPRVYNDLVGLYEGLRDGGELEKGSMIEAMLLVVVVVGEIAGLKWDGGYVQMFVDNLAEAALKKQNESAEVVASEIMEKGEFVVENTEVVEERLVQTKPQYRVLHNFTAESSNEISIVKGELLTINDDNGKGWTSVQTQSGRGWAPSAYLKEESTSEDACDEK